MSSKSIYTKNEFIQIFISVLGAPDSQEKLEEYFSVIFNNNLDEDSYSEIHHVLPKCIFSEYTHDSKNLIRLNQPIHVKAHKILAEAYNINQFINPLRFMNENIDVECRSLSVKRGWEKLKNNQKVYDEWREKRSKSCTEHMLNGHAKAMCEIARNNPEFVMKHKKASNDAWTVERKESFSKKMKVIKNRPEEKNKTSIASKKVWDNKTIEERDNFNEKMKIVNASESKRKKNSETAKRQWADPVWKAEFLRKRKQTIELKKRGNNETK